MQEAARGAQILRTHLSSMRNEAKFESFYSEVIHESVSPTAEPTLPRQSKGQEGLMKVQPRTDMKLPRTGIVTCTLK